LEAEGFIEKMKPFRRRLNERLRPFFRGFSLAYCDSKPRQKSLDFSFSIPEGRLPIRSLSKLRGCRWKKVQIGALAVGSSISRPRGEFEGSLRGFKFNFEASLRGLQKVEAFFEADSFSFHTFSSSHK
jgi:hypothetical protein